MRTLRPLLGAAAKLALALTGPDGSAVQRAHLQLRGDMAHPGIAPVLGRANERSAGEYPISFEWTMAGDWSLTIQGELPDGRQLLRTLPIRVEPVPATP